MRYSLKYKLLLITLFIVLSVLSACSTVSEYEPVEDLNSGNQISSIYNTTKEDTRVLPKENCVFMNFSENDDTIVISEGGDYELSGILNRQLAINAEENVVHLFLNGVQIQSIDGSAICVESAGKVIITAMAGTQNILSDSENTDSSAESDACIYSESDVTINGEGSLTVTGKYKKGIHTKDILKIIDTNMSIQAPSDSIKANDGAFIKNATLDIQSNSNGIRTSKDGKNYKGSIEIRDSKISLVSGEYGIVSANDLIISSSEVSIKSIYPNSKVDGDSYIENGNIIEK